MSQSSALGAEYFAGSSYQQQYGSRSGAGGNGARAEGDAAYAQRLQQQEFQGAQQQPLPTVAGTPVRPAPSEGMRYVTMYPPLAAFDPADLGVTGNFIAPHEVRLMEAFALGRMIRILAILDGIILLLNCAYFTVLFLMLWAPLAGWMAGTRFSTAWTYAYVCYYILRLSGDIAYILSGYLWFILVFVVNLIIARYILRFAKVLNSLTPAEIEQLRNPSGVWSGRQGVYREGVPFQTL